MYPKGGNSDYAKVNPVNYRLVFTQEQISASLHASQLYEPVLRAMVLMDLEQLNSDILSALHSNPLYVSFNDIPKPHWTMSPDGFLWHHDLIYVPDSHDLRLHILHHKHDHILSVTIVL